MVTFCKFLQTIDSLGGSAGAQTRGQLIKSHIQANTNNKQQFILSYLYIVESYHLMPIFGIKYDKFVTKSQALTTPYGIPPFIVFQRQKQSPQKKSNSQKHSEQP